MKRQTLVLAILSACLAVMFSTGIRQSFGLFLAPITETLGIGRGTFSLAIAWNNLIYGLPLVGILADRIGSRWVMIVGGLLYAAGLFLLTQVGTALGLFVSMGVLVGLALSATTYVVVLGAVAQIVPAAERTRTFGIITAAGSSGMFVVPPLAQWLLGEFGWQTALMALAGITLIIVVLSFGMPRKTAVLSDTTATDNTPFEEPFIKILNRAAKNRSYLLLFISFFVCGFHVAFIATHLPVFLTDNGLDASFGAAALSLVGGFNIAGSYFFGWLGDRYRKKYLLSFLYGARAVVILIFISLPITAVSALLFGGAIGFLWLATVPLTSGSVAQIFGTRYLSTLYGFVFLGHQIGAFLGVWLGGRLYDSTGSYSAVWTIAIALGVLGAIVCTPISEKTAVSPQPS